MRYLRAAVAPAAVVILLAATACGGGSDSPDGPLAVAASQDAALAACLEDHGEDGSLLGIDARRASDPDLDRVVRDCAARIGVDLPEPGEFLRAHNEMVRQVHRCLRDAGWDIPEPSQAEHGGLALSVDGEAVADDQWDAYSTDFERCVEQHG